ncbi:GntR family transcriptional regulator [Aurantimonas sp. A2-1-M11]|uniref:GntR family transcriptional regulator n=1 Tax=Aurantimonas sp. A2-1-M11 TaxID=3113712 RepID=UPI002F933485
MDTATQSERKTKLARDEAYAKVKATLFQDDDPDRVYSERTLSKRLGLGLASVRSAIGRLQIEGMIVVLPHAGFLLKPMTMRSISDFYEVRGIVESHVVAALTGRLDAQRIASLEEILDEQSICAAAGDGKAFHRLDMQFHATMAKLHGNDEIVRILERLEDRMHRLSVGLHGRHPERLQPLVDQHKEILKEIATGDAEISARKLRDHIGWGHSMLLSNDSKRQIIP